MKEKDTRPLLVVVTEKPFTARVLAPHLSHQWPSHRIAMILTNYVGLYEFRYPRGLRLADYPVIEEPRWKLRKGYPVMAVEDAPLGAMAHAANYSPKRLLKKADRIVYAADPDSSSAVAYHILLDQALGSSSAAVPRRSIIMHAMDDASIERAFMAPTTTADGDFQAWLRAGQARQFFTYNFNANALAIMGEVLRRVGGTTARMSGVGMSKYGLQLLYALRGHEPFEKAGGVHQTMARWHGTGKYADACWLGSPASAGQILQNLEALALIGPTGKGYGLLPAGEAFLQLLHPDCEDPDLPFRMRQWETAWPTSRPTMARYLRTFFGKQRRFMQKAGRGPAPAHCPG